MYLIFIEQPSYFCSTYSTLFMVPKLLECCIFQVLQEITQVLPEERQHHALETIQKAIKEKQRLERERMKSGIYRKQHRMSLDSYRTLPPGFSKINAKGCAHENESTLFSLFEDGQSLSISSSGTSTSLRSDERYKDKTYVVNNPSDPTVYYDAPVTYFLNEEILNWRNPTAQPYLKLSSDNRLSLSPASDGVVPISGDSNALSIRM